MTIKTTQIILFCSTFLSYPLANHSFSIHSLTTTSPRVVDFKTSTPTSSTSSSKQFAFSSSHQELFDAEEAAAYDAHDVSDAGLEAVMMEAAVMTADEIFKSYRKEKASFVTSQKQRTEGATNEPYDDFVEHKFHFEKDFLDSSTKDVDEGHTAVESLAFLIKDVDE